MPSSTSNSKRGNSSIPYRTIPDKQWGNICVVALLIAGATLSAWEGFARFKQHLPGTYQSGHKEMWALERKKLDIKDHRHRVVITGSSRILWAADLDILEQGLGTRPIQLALPGTSPAIFVEDIVNNTDFDGLILVGYTPFLVNWIGPGFFGGPALDFYHKPSPSAVSGFYLHNFLSDYFGFLDESFSLPELKNQYLEFPLREGAKVLNQQGWKLGNAYADRQTDMWPPVEIRGSFDNQQMLNFWSVGINLKDPIPDAKQEQMNKGLVEYFRPLIDKQRSRGGDIVFIRMPSSGDYLAEERLNNYTERFWNPVIEQLNVAAIDSFDFPMLSTELDIPEWSHFSRDSQDLWSARIVQHIHRVYEEVHGEPLGPLLNGNNKD